MTKKKSKKEGIVKEIDLGDYKLVVGEPHPRYRPKLIVERIDKNGNVKFKGLRGLRNPRYPMLVQLNEEERAEFDKDMEDLAKHGTPDVTQDDDFDGDDLEYPSF